MSRLDLSIATRRLRARLLQSRQAEKNECLERPANKSTSQPRMDQQLSSGLGRPRLGFPRLCPISLAPVSIEVEFHPLYFAKFRRDSDDATM